MTRFSTFVFPFLSAFLLLPLAHAQTTAFNYQGKLNNGGVAANGAFQMQFKLNGPGGIPPATNGIAVNTAGRVGIGTTAPSAKLEVNGQGGTALAITNGAIRVTGAGVGSNTAAFIYVKTAANTCGGALGTQSSIDNPFSNGDPNAILIITARAGEGCAGCQGSLNEITATYYPAALVPPSCSFMADRWAIVVKDASPVGSQFNVLVIKP